MGSGVAVVHVSRLYAKGSSHFEPPRRVMRLQNTRVAEHQRKQQVAREGGPLDTAGWNTKPPFQQFKSLLRDGCNAASDWHGTGGQTKADRRTSLARY